MEGNNFRITNKKEEPIVPEQKRNPPTCDDGLNGLVEKFSNFNPFKTQYLNKDISTKLPSPSSIVSIDFEGENRSENCQSAASIFESEYLAEHEAYLLEAEPDLSKTLERTRVTPNLRTKMVDWMLEVFGYFYNSKSIVTYFRAIGILDLYMKQSGKNSKKVDNTEVHLIGTTCMFIASKMEEVYHINLEDFETKVTHGKISESQIKRKEKEILETIDYNLAFPTSFNFLCLYFHKYFESQLNSESFETIKTMAYRLLKLANYDVTMNDFKPHIIAISALIYSIDTFFEEMHVMNKNSTESLNRAHKKIIRGIIRTDFEGQDDVKACFFRLCSLNQEFDATYGKDYHNYKLYLS